MGFLSDGARSAYRKAGGSAYVPDWYRSAIWAGAIIAAGGVLFTAVLNDNEAPPSTYTQTNTANDVVPLPSDGPSQPTGGTVTLRGLDGSRYDVPQSAYEAAAAAGLALWTGDWSGVPITGELPDTAGIYPQARLGAARVVDADDRSVSLLFELDQEGNGRITQEFQVTVVASESGWAYPAFGG